jgi:hypothetical protein
MPFESGLLGTKKKSKDGGAGVYLDSNLVALKGGNTQEFWRLDLRRNEWVELDTMPRYLPGGRARKVKNGGDLTLIYPASERPGVPVSMPALKGNDTREGWVYDSLVDAGGDKDGIAGRQSAVYDMRATISIAPNPLASGFAAIRLSGPAAEWSSGMVRVHDAAGRCIVTCALGAGRGASSVSLDLRAIPAGVYLVTVSGRDQTFREKLVVER